MAQCSAQFCTTQDLPIYPAEQYGVYAHVLSLYNASPSVSAQSHAHARHARHSRSIHSRVRWFTHVSCFSYAHHTLMCMLWDCFHWSMKMYPQTHSRTRQCPTCKSMASAYTAYATMQLASSNFRSWARYITAKEVMSYAGLLIVFLNQLLMTVQNIIILSCKYNAKMSTD